MTNDVVVVGGGIGGLTVAALLATRGLRVCLFERQSQVGGCIGRVEFSNLQFDPGMGLYTGFGEGEVFEQLFNELKVTLPGITPVDSEYVVRLSGDVDVKLFPDKQRFIAELEQSFPECKENAIEFYGRVDEIIDQHRRAKSSPIGSSNIISNLFRRRPSTTDAAQQVQRVKTERVGNFLAGSSPRFRRFIEAQLQSFIQSSVDECDLFSASIALGHPLKQMYQIEGGPGSIAEKLVEVIKSAGGSVRLNTSVLRATFDANGRAIGVDLLSGETVHATKAIVSNMTIWDTYGKLIGLNRTPAEIKSQLSKLNSNGAYLIYAAIEDSAFSRLPSRNFLVAEEQEEFTFASFGQAVTLKKNCEVEPWFAYQTSEEDAEERDQEMLASFWSRVHQAIPELGDSIEVIETANPRTHYDQTRRKLGKVLGTQHSTATVQIPYESAGIYMVGDTTSEIPTLDSIAESSIALASQLTK